VYLPVLPCILAFPDLLSISVTVNVTLAKTGGSAAGLIILALDADPPFNCQQGPGTTSSTGPVTLTPLLLNNDTDGDGCTDWYELGENPDLGGLRDPFNPTDCSVVMEPHGLYEIRHEFAGGYRRCMASVDAGPSPSMDVYCYNDIGGVLVNPQAFPADDPDGSGPLVGYGAAASGDGLPGAPPPGPKVTGGPDPPGCRIFEPPYCPWGTYISGDVNDVAVAHTTLSGSLNGNTLTFTGCFGDTDGPAGYEYINVTWEWNVQSGQGTSRAAASGGSCSGTGPAMPLQAMKLATTQQTGACYSGPGVCPFADNDGDGVPDHRELGDDYTDCGLRDPFNKWDYYDVAGPGGSPTLDGVIDLSNDILGVILHYSPSGYAAYPERVRFDRAPDTTTGAGHWNRFGAGRRHRPGERHHGRQRAVPPQVLLAR
jgi:hypothetical protein